MQTRPVTPRRESAQGGARSTGVNTAASERRRGGRPSGQNPPAPPAPTGPDKPGRFSLRSWRVRNRLFLLVCFPLVIAIGIGATRVNTLYQDRTHYENLRFQASTVTEVEALVLALQEERQAAEICLADAKGAPCTSSVAPPAGVAGTDLIELSNAETNTQQVLTELTASANAVVGGSNYSTALRQATVEAVGRTNDLAYIRQVVTKDSAPFTVSYNAYTSVIDDVLNVVANAASGTSDTSVNQDNQALTSLGLMVEAEAESAVITDQVILLQAPLSPSQVQSDQAVTVKDAQAAFAASTASFQSTAPASLVQSYEATVSGPEVAGAATGINSATNFLYGTQTFSDVSSTLTSAVQTDDLATTLGDLRAVQTVAIAQMQNDTQSLLNGANGDLYLNIAIIIIALLISFAGTILVARSLTRPLGLLRAAALDIAATRLPEMVRRLRDADAASADANSRVEPIPITSSDEIGEVARSFDEVHQQAVRLASEQAMLRANVNSMFVNLSRRSQSLVQRQLRLIDELENSEQDPDQLANLFKLDHLATRMRRNGENLLVLAGEEPGRKWSQAVRLLDVLRAGASEVEQYERVQLRDLPDTNVVGRVVNDLVHLVAELLENATSFSAPETKVAVTANTLNTGGVMLEIEDSGIGMTPEELDDANERLANPPVIDVAISRRMGLYVVGRLATRHGIQVRLRRSAGGGITALVLVPSSLLAGVENEQAPATALSATGVRSLGALPRRGIGSEQFPAFAASPAEGFGGPVDPLSSSLGGRAADADTFGDSEEAARRAFGQSIPSARTPMDAAPGDTLSAPPVGPPVNPFAPQLPESETQGPASQPFSQELPSRPAAPFGAEPMPGLPQSSGGPYGGGQSGPLGQSAQDSAQGGYGQGQQQSPDSMQGGYGQLGQSPESAQGGYGQLGQSQQSPESAQGGYGQPGQSQQSPQGGFGQQSQPPQFGQPGQQSQSQQSGFGQEPGSSFGGEQGRAQSPAAPAPGNPFRAAPRAELNLDGSAPQQFQQLPPQGQPQTPAMPPQPPANEPLGRSGASAPPAPPARAAESTGQLPRIRDVGSTGQFPVVPAAAAAPAPPQQPPAIAPRTPSAPPAPPRASDDTGQFRLSPRPTQAAGPGPDGSGDLGSGEYSVAERLFAADQLPPAPATDERLPIFEAMESEWFRRRDEARAQAAQNAQSPRGVPAAPAPQSAAPVQPAALPQSSAPAQRSALDAASSRPAVLPQQSAVEAAPSRQAPMTQEPASPLSSSLAASASIGSGSTTREPSIQSTPPAPTAAAPTSAGDRPMESPLPSGQSAMEEGRAPQGAGAATWSSPGDEGWRAAQAAAKPVAAGLTQKGLPKRVPKSNLVPGSAGGNGAAKAAPPLAPRSAEEVRGKLSSFHRGLRQGRDAAGQNDSGESER